MITEGFLARHHMGRAGMAAPALLDVAQDYALHYLHQQKVWHDTVDDRLGTAPFDPAELITNFDTHRLPSEDIGLLTQPVQPQRWLNHMTTRYSFITDLDHTERQLATCSPPDRYLANQAIAELTT